MVAREGIEPPTPAFSGLRSTPELPGHISKPAHASRARNLFSSRRLYAGFADETSTHGGACGTSLIIATAVRFAQCHPRLNDPCKPDSSNANFSATKSGAQVRAPLLDSMLPTQSQLPPYFPPAVPCSPSHDASCGSCCAFRSTQLLMRSIDCL
jgi:hypothetical protein